MTLLADAVLPLIRTRSDLYRYSAANAHGRDMHEAVDILERAIPTTDPAEVYAVTHKALASAIKVIAKLRETHRRRPRLQQEFDRAGLLWRCAAPKSIPRSLSGRTP